MSVSATRTRIPVLADLVPGARVRDVVLTLIGTAFITVSGYIVIPLPFTPVPISLATFAVLLTGATLGPLRGAASAGLYLALGVIGVPLFALFAVVLPLYVHYELPLRAYVLTASRWMLRNLAHALLLILAGVVVVTASMILPGIIPFLSLGAWLTIDTALCLAFFAANDRHLIESVPAAAR